MNSSTWLAISRAKRSPTQCHPLLSKRDLSLQDNYTNPHGFATSHANRAPSHVIPPSGSRFAWKVEMEPYNNRLRFALKAGGNVGWISFRMETYMELYGTVIGSKHIAYVDIEKIIFYSLHFIPW